MNAINKFKFSYYIILIGGHLKFSELKHAFSNSLYTNFSVGCKLSAIFEMNMNTTENAKYWWNKNS